MQQVFPRDIRYTAWKVSIYGGFSGPYFSVFGLNTGKYRPEKFPYLDTFHIVILIYFWPMYLFYNIWKHQKTIWNYQVVKSGNTDQKWVEKNCRKSVKWDERAKVRGRSQAKSIWNKRWNLGNHNYFIISFKYIYIYIYIIYMYICIYIYIYIYTHS